MTTPTTPDQARELADSLYRSFKSPECVKALGSLSAQVEALTAERNKLKEASDFDYSEYKRLRNELIVERDSLRAELDQLKKQEPVFFVTKECVEWLEFQKRFDMKLQVTGHAYSFCDDNQPLYLAPSAQPAEIEALRADAARYAAKRKEIFLKRNRMQVSGPRSTEEEFNSEYDANCDKAIKGYVADHRGVLVFNSAMVAAKAAS